jgi:nicotinate phosphoribosyltransferase
LVEVVEDGRARLVMKTSVGKATLPGRKQVWRVIDGGRAARDVLALADEPSIADAQPLLERVMLNGARTGRPLPLAHARAWCAERLAELPSELKRIDREAGYAVQPSPGLSAAIAQNGDTHSYSRTPDEL